MITNEASIDRQARTGDRSSELLVRYAIDEEDLQRIRKYGALASLRLDRYVEHELAGNDVDATIPGLRAHLEGCPACREEYESLRALVAGEPATG